MVGRRLADAIDRREPYTGYYLRGIIQGKFRLTQPLALAMKMLEAQLDGGGLPDGATTGVAVRVLPGKFIEPGALCLAGSRVCICGISFIPAARNQVYHSKACKRLAERMARRQKHAISR